jgi:hypothetical protein
LSCEIVEPQYGNGRTYSAVNGVALPGPTRQSVLTFRALPYRPVWLGLVVDTVVYAGLWGLLVVGGRGLLRRARIGRGRCPLCAYELGPSGGTGAGCPECGWGR